MKTLLLTLVSLLMLMLSGCGKNEFIVKGALDASVTENYRVLYYAADKRGGFITEATLVISEGKGELKGITRLPCVVYVFDGGDVPVVSFYARRGDKITISGSSANPREWSFSGNDINKQWSEWRADNLKALSSPYSANAAVEKFVAEHPDDPLSLILLMTIYDRRLSDSHFRSLFDSLGEKARDAEWLRLFNPASSVGSDSFNVPGVTATGFPVRVNPDSMVTLKYDETPRTLFWFCRRSDNPSRTELATIRNLIASNPSDRLRVNVILFAADSVAIARNHLADSVPSAHFYWAPEAEASPAAAALGVTSTPRFVVTDRRGRTLYNGADMSAASKAIK
ncbi:MAG: DUF4369 domain-containing protein [Bacteroidales bacterium]|nr:DUF4369 domain-containing protein [Bacteroidales bacterium]